MSARSPATSASGILAALVLVILLSTSAPATATTYVPQGGNPNDLRHKPRHLWLSGDSTFLLTRIHWFTYGGRVARAKAIGKVNDCEPYCAAGSFHSARVRLRFSRPRQVCGERAYTRVRIRWTGVHPLGMRNRTWNLVAAGCT